MWDLRSQTRDQSYTPCVGGWILNHWSTREVPLPFLIFRLSVWNMPFLYHLAPASWSCLLRQQEVPSPLGSQVFPICCFLEILLILVQIRLSVTPYYSLHLLTLPPRPHTHKIVGEPLKVKAQRFQSWGSFFPNPPDLGPLPLCPHSQPIPLTWAQPIFIMTQC